jgi:hypothetical protein
MSVEDQSSAVRRANRERRRAGELILAIDFVSEEEVWAEIDALTAHEEHCRCWLTTVV